MAIVAAQSPRFLSEADISTAGAASSTAQGLPATLTVASVLRALSLLVSFPANDARRSPSVSDAKARLAVVEELVQPDQLARDWPRFPIERRRPVVETNSPNDVKSSEERLVELESMRQRLETQIASLRDELRSFESKQLTKTDVMQTIALMVGVAAGLVAIVGAVIGGVVVLLKFAGVVH